jgi:hypothetical protein
MISADAVDQASLVSLMTLARGLGRTRGSDGPARGRPGIAGGALVPLLRGADPDPRRGRDRGGFAAAYNTPIGATLFVLEVIIGSFNMVFFGPAVVAAAISTLVTRVSAGPGPIYAPGPSTRWCRREVGPYLVLGFLAGWRRSCSR